MRSTDAVRTQDNFVERIARGDSDVHAVVIDRSHAPARRSARRRFPCRPTRAPASSTTASAHPAARRSDDVVGPSTSTSSTRSDGANDEMAAAIPGVRATRTMPEPSPRTPAAIGGRFGPSRTTSSRDASTRTTRPCRSASSRAALIADGVDLATERASVGQRRRRLSSGRAPRRVRLEIGGLDPLGLQRQGPVAVGNGNRLPDVDGRSPALHLRRRPSRLDQGLAERPAAATIGHRDERVGRRRVVREPAAAQRHVGSDPLRRPTFERRPHRGAVEVPGRAGPVVVVIGAPGIEDRAPTGAPAQVREQPTLHPVDVVGLGPARPQRVEPHDDAGGAEAALAGAGGAESVCPSLRPIAHALERRDRAAGDTAGGSHARHPWLVVDEHGAAATLPLRAAAVLG